MKRALVIVLDDEERPDRATLRRKLEAKDYAVMQNPAAMWSDSGPRRLLGLVALPPETSTA